jgi:enoyl-[acyl-carrier-protein] reductase (NADH)
MKKSIIYLGVLALTFSNGVLASNGSFNFQEKGQVVLSSSDNALVNNVASLAKDTLLADIDVIVAESYEKSLEDVIKENNDITEYQPMEVAYIESSILDQYNVFNITIDGIQFASKEKTIDQIIEEDNQTIDNSETAEVYSLSYCKTIEEIILEDSMIIDSTLDTQVMPLDFEKINTKYVKPTNIASIATIK